MKWKLSKRLLFQSLVVLAAAAAAASPMLLSLDTAELVSSDGSA